LSRFAGIEVIRVSLFRRTVAVNAAVLVMAALLLALSPATVSATVTAQEWIVLGAGTTLVIAVNLLLLQRVFGPLERLEQTMERIDPLEPGRRIGVSEHHDEIARLGKAFNTMLDRLEHERADSGRRALRAQEAERARVARELHDEVGQLLTGVVLQLEGLSSAVAAQRRSEVTEVQDAVREGVQTVREIAQGLRPPALDEFGLRASLVALTVGFGERSGLRVRHHLDPDLPALDREKELALYRVAQEAMTNVARHAEAENVELTLEARDGAVILNVRDDGCGFEARHLRSATGVAGMRERARLVGGSLDIAGSPATGTDLRLWVPVP
jgi:two-component system, NarL family, sensor histidine kinase UhpB